MKQQRLMFPHHFSGRLIWKYTDTETAKLKKLQAICKSSLIKYSRQFQDSRLFILNNPLLNALNQRTFVF